MSWTLFKDLGPNETDAGARRDDERGFVFEVKHAGGYFRAEAVLRTATGSRRAAKSFQLDELEAAKTWVDMALAAGDAEETELAESRRLRVARLEAEIVKATTALQRENEIPRDALVAHLTEEGGSAR